MGFTGEPKDGTGLIYLRARYYDPSLGRFLTRDTWPGSGMSPITLNRYAYANDNPTTNTDHSGHFIDTIADIGFILWDIGSLVFGPEKDRGTNWAALGLDSGAVFIPGVTGAGFIARTGRAATKAMHLPGWKHVAIDMAHIRAFHIPGAVSRTSKPLTVFGNMSDRGIETAVREAYRYSTRVGGSGDRVILRGQAGRMTIEMVYNRVTKTIENAYPVVP